MGTPRKTLFAINILIIIECIGSIIWLLFIPGDPENSFVFDLSLRRLVLLLIPTLGGVLNAIFLFCKKSKKINFVYVILENFLTFLFLLLIFVPSFLGLLVWLFTADGMIRGIMGRLAPILLLVVLSSLQLILWQIYSSKGEISASALQFLRVLPSRFSNKFIDLSMRLYEWVDSPKRSFILVMLLSYIPLFGNALRYDLPLGYSGLYSLMSEEIVKNKFLLPDTIPFYGPGGLPFMYPPLGFYIMAISTRFLGISQWGYLIYAAPFFSLLSLIPLYYFALKISKSRVAASVCVVVTAYSSRVYMVHTLSAGMIRALAFLLVMTALYFYVRALQEEKNLFYALASLFFALTFLTHWLYAVFFVLVAAILGIFTLRWRTILKSFVMGIGGILLSSPWVLSMMHKYGATFLDGAFHSHGNDYFLFFLQDYHKLFPWIAENFRHINKDPWLTSLILIGLLYLIAIRKISLPVVLFAVLTVLSEADRFVVVVGGLIGGIMVNALWTQIVQSPSNLSNTNSEYKLKGLTFLILLTLVISWNGFNDISKYQPEISHATLELASFVQESTEPNTTYLVVAGAGEAEWFPYLLRRTPAIASWGSEWIGTYPEQVRYLLQVEECETKQDANCLETAILKFPAAPDYLITHQTTEQLNVGLKDLNLWKIVYKNQDYVLWQSVR